VGTHRIEAFSDAVFAIAVTLLVLDVHRPDDTDRLWHRLGELWPNYLAYVISFLLIGLAWANHHAMFQYIAHSDHVLLLLNTLLLMATAFLPFSTSVLAQALSTGDGERSAVAFYGGIVILGGLFFNALWMWARHDHHLLRADLTPASARAIQRVYLVGPIFYLIGTVLGLIQPIAGLVVFAFLILLYWLPLPVLTKSGHGSPPRRR
jgi:uncharacterized membrane protein